MDRKNFGFLFTEEAESSLYRFTFDKEINHNETFSITKIEHKFIAFYAIDSTFWRCIRNQ